MPVPTLKKLQRREKWLLKKIAWVDFALKTRKKFDNEKLQKQRVNLYQQLSLQWCDTKQKIDKILNKKLIK